MTRCGVKELCQASWELTGHKGCELAWGNGERVCHRRKEAVGHEGDKSACPVTRGMKATVVRAILKKKGYANWALVGLTWERKGSYCWVLVNGLEWALNLGSNRP